MIYNYVMNNMEKVDLENILREKDKKYSEYFAKAMLALCEDKLFVKATNGESPDIHLVSKNFSCGVEVTRFVASYYKELKKYTKAWAKNNMTLEQIVKSLPENLQDVVGINEYGLIVPMQSLGEHISNEKMKQQLADIYQSKTERLQQYKLYDSNRLFIFATELNPKLKYGSIFTSFLNKANVSDYIVHYDRVYIFTYNALYTFNLKDHYSSSNQIKPISGSQIAICNKYAKQMAKKGHSTVLDDYFRAQEQEIEK